jgi:hypothetical protein
MSTIPALGARPFWSSLFPSSATSSDNKSGKAAAATSQPVTPVQDSSASLSSSGLDLQKRLSDVGNNTIDLAQNLLGSFTQSLFGDAGKGASISFDSVSLEAQSSFGVAVQHTQDANGTTDSAALQLTDSAHFLGKGTITTADGRKFDFEVEIKYSDELDAGISQYQNLGQGTPVTTQPAGGSGTPGASGAGSTTPPVSGTPASGSTGSSSASGASSGTPASTGAASGSSDDSSSPSSSSLPTVIFPNIDFPGTLADLFKLIGHDLQSTLSTPHLGGDKGQGSGIDRTTLRSLSLRLLSLVDKKNSDTYDPPSLAKSVADTYGAQSGQSGSASQASAGDAQSSASDAAAASTAATAPASAPAPAATASADAAPAADASVPAASAPAANDNTATDTAAA